LAFPSNIADREYRKFLKDVDGNPAVGVVLTGAIPSNYDDMVLTYTGTNLTTVVYKLETVTIRTLTLTYTDNVLDRVQIS